MPRKSRPAESEALSVAVIWLVSPLKPLPCQAVDSMVFIRPEEIAYITAVPGGLDVVDIQNKRWKRFDSLVSMAGRLQGDPLFFKTSRGEIVNLRQVRALFVLPSGSREISFKSLPADVRVGVADSSYVAFKKAMGISDKVDAKAAGLIEIENAASQAPESLKARNVRASAARIEPKREKASSRAGGPKSGKVARIPPANVEAEPGAKAAAKSSKATKPGRKTARSGRKARG